MQRLGYVLIVVVLVLSVGFVLGGEQTLGEGQAIAEGSLCRSRTFSTGCTLKKPYSFTYFGTTFIIHVQ